MPDDLKLGRVFFIKVIILAVIGLLLWIMLTPLMT